VKSNPTEAQNVLTWDLNYISQIGAIASGVFIKVLTLFLSLDFRWRIAALLMFMDFLIWERYLSSISSNKVRDLFRISYKTPHIVVYVISKHFLCEGMQLWIG
jgi:hypothetical protein